VLRFSINLNRQAEPPADPRINLDLSEAPTGVELDE
jgi:hypothetical protein